MGEIDTKSCYLCVYCLTPSKSLYKQFSNNKNIKLQTCTECKQDLDPYIEREVLLVLMDMMLLRSASYIHFIFNRKRYIQGFLQQGNDTAALECSFLYNSTALTLVVAIMKTLLKCIGNNEFFCLLSMDDSLCSTNRYQIYFRFAVWSVSDMFWLVTWSFLMITILLRLVCSSIFNNDVQFKAFLLDQIYLSIMIPHIFHTVTLFVQMYENSSEVRFLGSIFVACFSFCSMNCMIEGILAEIKAVSVFHMDLKISNRHVRQVITAFTVIGCLAWEAVDVIFGRSVHSNHLFSRIE